MHNVLNAYQSAVKQVLTGRELEAAVLHKAASRLRVCHANWDGTLNDQLAQALEMTRAIWTVLQGDLMDTTSPLPQPLRVNLLKISSLIDRLVLEIVAEPVQAKVELLIDINVGIAEGLLSGPGASHGYRGAQALYAA